MSQNVNIPKSSVIPNLIGLAVLYLSFSITFLSQPSLSMEQKVIIYMYLGASALLAIVSLLPQSMTNFMKNKFLLMILYIAANLAWFFTFAMKWLDGIKNTHNIDQQIISWVGIVFLLAIVVIITRYLKELSKYREVGLLLPIAIGIQATHTLINRFDLVALIAFLIYVGAPICVIYTRWKPGGDLPFIP